MSGIVERHAYVGLTTTDVPLARSFWADALELPVVAEDEGHSFTVDAGGVRLCVGLADGDLHRPGGTDPVVGLEVQDLREALATLADHGVHPIRGPVPAGKGDYAVLQDPDGRLVILTEHPG